MAQPVDQKQSSSEQYSAEPKVSLDNERLVRPFSAVLAELPQKYLNAVTKPAVRTYSEVCTEASWGLVWTQLLIWAVLDAALGVLVNLISSPASGFSSFFSLVTSVGLVVLVPLLFFLVMAVTYIMARVFDGQGTFLEQCHASLYVQVPLGIGSKVLALIPMVGRILNSVLSVYGIVLQVIVLMTVHKLSKGKAIAVALVSGLVLGIPVGVLYALFLLMTHK